MNRPFQIGRTKAHALARAGDFPVPVLRIGPSYRVPTQPIKALLGLVPEVHDPRNSDAGLAGPAIALVPPATTAEEGRPQYVPDPPAA